MFSHFPGKMFQINTTHNNDTAKKFKPFNYEHIQEQFNGTGQLFVGVLSSSAGASRWPSNGSGGDRSSALEAGPLPNERSNQ